MRVRAENMTDGPTCALTCPHAPRLSRLGLPSRRRVPASSPLPQQSVLTATVSGSGRSWLTWLRDPPLVQSVSANYAPARERRWWLRPAGSVVAAYLVVLIAGIILLYLPIAKVGEGGATLMQAAFTATSVVCVTGLAVVDTATYWTGFGQGVIFVLCELGGLGVMSLTTLVVLGVSHRIGLRQRMSASAESGFGPGMVKGVVRLVVVLALVCQSIIAMLLTLRWWLHYDYSFPKALWLGVFHAASAFNNLGFALFSDNLMGFTEDWWICGPICAGIILGGLGLPVIIEMWRHRLRWGFLRRATGHDQLSIPRRWTVHTRMVLVGTGVLIISGFVGFLLFEWGNPGTLGPLSGSGKVLAALCLSVFPRTGGFNSVNVADLSSESWFTTDVLMYIGGAPASTAGGLKITTLGVLVAIAVTEIRGNAHTRIYDRVIPAATQRSAVAVSAAFTAAVLTATGVLLILTPYELSDVLTEAISALATVGLSTGITPSLSEPALLVLMLLMFAGRLGPITLAAALALNARPAHYQLPEERPYIG